MRSERQQAVTSAEATAQNYNRLNQSYQDSVAASRAKLQIGELLLALQAPLSQNQQKKYWVEFESKLRQYLNLKFIEVTE